MAAVSPTRFPISRLIARCQLVVLLRLLQAALGVEDVAQFPRRAGLGLPVTAGTSEVERAAEGRLGGGGPGGHREDLAERRRNLPAEFVVARLLGQALGLPRALLLARAAAHRVE